MPADNYNRIIDANYNRAKEGLRVCEDIARFILNSSSMTRGLKNCRHGISSACSGIAPIEELLKQRRSCQDVGKRIYGRELKRNGAADIFFANIQRVKESLRVLEEFSKLKKRSCAVSFKGLRYRIYGIEKKFAQKLAALSHT